MKKKNLKNLKLNKKSISNLELDFNKGGYATGTRCNTLHYDGCPTETQVCC